MVWKTENKNIMQQTDGSHRIRVKTLYLVYDGSQGRRQYKKILLFLEKSTNDGGGEDHVHNQNMFFTKTVNWF